MGMLMILREDRFKLTKTAKENQDKKIQSVRNDPFWNKNFNKKAIGSNNQI